MWSAMILQISGSLLVPLWIHCFLSYFFKVCSQEQHRLQDERVPQEAQVGRRQDHSRIRRVYCC